MPKVCQIQQKKFTIFTNMCYTDYLIMKRDFNCAFMIERIEHGYKRS